jgi:hypothetical protein
MLKPQGRQIKNPTKLQSNVRQNKKTQSLKKPTKKKNSFSIKKQKP